MMSQLFPHEGTRPVEPAADCADRHIENSGDRPVVETVHVAHHQHEPVFFGESAEGPLDFRRTFFAHQPIGRVDAGIGQFVAWERSDGIQGRFLSPSPLSIQGGVDGDAVEPSVKRAVLTEGVELEHGLDKRILRHVFCFLTTGDDVHQAGEQAILIATYQLTVGGRIAEERLFDELLVFVHRVENPSGRVGVPVICRHRGANSRKLPGSAPISLSWRPLHLPVNAVGCQIAPGAGMAARREPQVTERTAFGRRGADPVRPLPRARGERAGTVADESCAGRSGGLLDGRAADRPGNLHLRLQKAGTSLN